MSESLSSFGSRFHDSSGVPVFSSDVVVPLGAVLGSLALGAYRGSGQLVKCLEDCRQGSNSGEVVGRLSCLSMGR